MALGQAGEGEEGPPLEDGRQSHGEEGRSGMGGPWIMEANKGPGGALRKLLYYKVICSRNESRKDSLIIGPAFFGETGPECDGRTIFLLIVITAWCKDEE